MIVRVFFLAAMLVLVCAGPAKAQLFLEDGKVVLTVSGGDRINKFITINNTGSQSIPVKVYWEDFQYKPPYDGTKTFLPAGSSPDSLNGWVSFSPQQFTLPAFGKQQINYTVSIPDQITSGHYGVLFFEKAVPMKDASGVHIITRVGCLFFVEPKNKSRTAVLQNLDLKGVRLSGVFGNEGNVILIPHITYYVMDPSGLVVDRGELRKLYVPAGAAAHWQIKLSQQLKPGQYTLFLNADLGNGDAATKEISFTKDDAGLRITNAQD